MSEPVQNSSRSYVAGIDLDFSGLSITGCSVISVNFHTYVIKKHPCVLQNKESFKDVPASVCMPDLANQSCRMSIKDKLLNLEQLLQEPAVEFGRIILEIKGWTESLYPIAERNHSESTKNVAGRIQTNM